MALYKTKQRKAYATFITEHSNEHVLLNGSSEKQFLGAGKEGMENPLPLGCLP